MRGNKTFPMADLPLPTTLILAIVAAERNDLKAQKIQLKIVGTLTKNFLYWAFSQQRITEVGASSLTKNSG